MLINCSVEIDPQSVVHVGKYAGTSGFIRYRQTDGTLAKTDSTPVAELDAMVASLPAPVIYLDQPGERRREDWFRKDLVLIGMSTSGGYTTVLGHRGEELLYLMDTTIEEARTAFGF